MAKNVNRKNFLKNAGVLGLAGIFGLSKMGNITAKAAVLDNAESEDISKDVIRCNSTGVFESGETAEDLADAVNGLNDSFSNALTDLKSTDVAEFVGAQGSTFTVVIEKLKNILSKKEITATTSVQTVLPDTSKVLQEVKVNPQIHTETKTLSTYTDIDLGDVHNVRKVVTKKPSGTKSITSNGTVNVADYQSVNVNVSPSIAVSNGNVIINESTLWGTGRSKTYSISSGQIVVAIVNSSTNKETDTHISTISFSGSKTNLIEWSGYTSKNNSGTSSNHCHTKILVFKATSNGTLTLTTSLSGSYITGTMQAIILN